ncbi:hypothetical protein PHYC_00292 [Phycisphaerales bacterium]|nr:hypothetical protein PHYC_00292 [Phycisphaerales bacterium]
MIRYPLIVALGMLGPGMVCAQPAPTNQARFEKPDRWAMAARAAVFLRAQQDKATGGWNVNPQGPTLPAITGLVVQGLLMQEGVDEKDPAVSAGIAFILSKQQPDGGIYDRILPTYNTAICLSALAKIKSPSAEVRSAMVKAQEFLKGLQYGEGAAVREGAVEAAERVSRDHPYYGGWGYGNRGRPDLSNSAFIIEALRESGVSESDAAFQRALVFLQRCQMIEKGSDGKIINGEPYAKGSTQGGFIYSTSENKDKPGSGQSFAGEVAESLSGPAGLAARVTLKAKGADGKPVTLTREEIRTRLREKAKESSNPEHAGLGDRCVILFGPGSTDTSANSFEVRAPGDVAPRFEILVGSAFADVAEAPVTAKAVEHWQGESRLRAYGSMTYSGFKSYVYAGLARNDPRVVAAREWIARNYTLEENPGVGTDGLYYYLLVFSRAMHAWGEPTLRAVGAEGGPVTHEWKQDLVERLSRLQQSDGSFRSVDDRWMESDPVLITAYSLVALEHAE